MTLYYTILWVVMMIVGILLYEQPGITKLRGKVFPALQQIGWMIMFTAMLGLIHGILGIFGLIKPL